MGGGREGQEAGDVYIPLADSCGCMAEINTIFSSNYPSIKNKYINNVNCKTSKQKYCTVYVKCVKGVLKVLISKRKKESSSCSLP